jgi:hypothetical protein
VLRSRIVFVEPESQRDAAPALGPTAPASNLMFNIGRLSKMSQTTALQFFTFPIQFNTNLNVKKSGENIAQPFY